MMYLTFRHIFLLLFFPFCVLGFYPSITQANDIEEDARIYFPNIRTDTFINELPLTNLEYKKLKFFLPKGYRGSSEQYIVELLKYNDHKKAVSVTKGINNTGINWFRLHSVLAVYMAQHGACTRVEDISKAAMENPNYLKSFPKKTTDLDYAVSRLIIAYALCNESQKALELMRNYNPDAETNGANYRTKEEYRKKNRWKVSIFSKIGAYLHLRGQVEASKDYFKIAINSIHGLRPYQKSKSFDNIVYSYIQAGLIQDAYSIAKLSTNGKDIYQSLLMAAAYHENTGLMREMLYSSRISKFVRASYADALILLIDRKRKNAFFELKPFLDDLYSKVRVRQSKGNRNVLASIYIAKIFALNGDTKKSNKIMGSVEAWVKQTYSVNAMPLEYPQEIAKAYVLIDRTPYRAFSVMTDWFYPANKSSHAWGYIIGSAKEIEDDEFLNRVLRGLKRDYPNVRKYKSRETLYKRNEIEFFSILKNYDKADSLVRERPTSRSRYSMYRPIIASVANESSIEQAFGNFKVTGDIKLLKQSIK